VENHSPLQFPEGYVYVDVTLEGPYEFVIGTDWRSQHISEVYTEDEFWDNDNLPPNRHWSHVKVRTQEDSEEETRKYILAQKGLLLSFIKSVVTEYNYRLAINNS